MDRNKLPHYLAAEHGLSSWGVLNGSDPGMYIKAKQKGLPPGFIEIWFAHLPAFPDRFKQCGKLHQLSDFFKAVYQIPIYTGDRLEVPYGY